MLIDKVVCDCRKLSDEGAMKTKKAANCAEELAALWIWHELCNEQRGAGLGSVVEPVTGHLHVGAVHQSVICSACL